MATKKSITGKKRVVKRISLPELLSIIEKGYGNDMMPEWSSVLDKRGKLVKPGDLGDTLAIFLIREIGEFYNPRAGATTNLDSAAEAVRTAIEELVRVEAALLRARWGEEKPR